MPAVVRIEKSAYPQPWSERNFLDSLQAGYQAQLLMAGTPDSPELLGYFVAMKGVDEVHLLNITVAPGWQRQGWGRVMLDALGIWARGQGALWLWLEVRVSNGRAREVYESHGFRHVGTRRRYYPPSPALPQGEDAIVMSLPL
ncbi:MAG: ribosomal protein S18P -alanine acetyltransferase [Polaromonas sp.]|nr:ribosomal protein S18P -alanine acetyltransferase [Polaromonas sp.]